MNWSDKCGQSCLVDDDGRILGDVYRLSDGTYTTGLGGQRYIDEDSAKRAVEHKVRGGHG